MLQTTRDLSRVGSQVRDAVALEDLRSEFSVSKQPRRWFDRQLDIWRFLNPKAGLADDGYITNLKSTYVQVWLHILGWALLMGAAAGAMFLAIFDS